MRTSIQFLGLLLLLSNVLMAEESAEDSLYTPATPAPPQIGSIVSSRRIPTRRERQFHLNGIFHLGYTNSGFSSRFVNVTTETNMPELSWGLDFALRTYILDPRFISISLEPSILRASGSQDSRQTHRATTAGNFVLDFLRESYYPFHFHFTDQNLDYVQSHLSSNNTAYRSIGFDWAFRKPKFPRFRISYDDNHYNYELSNIPSSLNHAKTFSATTNGKFRGWDSSLSFDKENTTEAFSGQNNSTDAIRGNTMKDIFSHSTFIANGLLQHLDFSRADFQQSLPFMSFLGNLSTRHSQKLSSNLFYRFSWEGNIPVGDAITIPPESTKKQRSSSEHFQSVGESLHYQLIPGLSVGQTSDITYTSLLNPLVESATRTVNTGGSINWSRAVRFLRMQAGYQRGLAYLSTNFDNSHAIWFDGYNAGFGIGNRKYLLVEGNFSQSQKPDLFEIGGKYSQQTVGGSLDTQILRWAELRASFGRNQTDFLTFRGRERYHSTTYSASLVNRRFVLAASRNTGTGLQSLLFSPLNLGTSSIFRVLPVDALLNTPFSDTFSVNTAGSAEVKLYKGLDAEFRYFRQRLLYPLLSSVLIKRYEIFSNYRIGKFTLSGGILLTREASREMSQKNSKYYFFRISRPFRIL